MKRSSKIFTLVELLVVVSTISVLATLMLPSQKRALEQAKRISCQNNLKQLGVGFYLYSVDHGYYPTLMGPAAPHDWSFSYWKTQVAPYLGISVNYGSNALSGGNPGLGLGAFLCPSWDNAAIPNPVPAYRPHWGGGYGYNWCGEYLQDSVYVPMGMGYRVAVKPSEVTKPAETIAMADSSDLSQAWSSPALYTHTANPSSSFPGIGDRHEDGINIAWVDGHVSYMLKSEVITGKPGGNYPRPAADDQYYYRSVK